MLARRGRSNSSCCCGGASRLGRAGRSRGGRGCSDRCRLFGGGRCSGGGCSGRHRFGRSGSRRRRGNGGGRRFGGSGSGRWGRSRFGGRRRGGRDRLRRFGSGRFGGGLGRGLLAPGRLGLFGLLVAHETVALGAATHPVGLRFDERRRVALHIDTHVDAEVHHLLVCHSELFGELVHAHVLGQSASQSFVAAAGAPDTPAACDGPILPASAWNAPRSSESTAGSTARRHARSKPRRRTAVSKHSMEPAQSHAPRPAATRLQTAVPSPTSAQRTRSVAGRRVRQPTQVRTGPLASDSVRDVSACSSRLLAGIRSALVGRGCLRR